MRWQSRKHFIRSLFYLFLSAFASSLHAFFIGCKQKQPAKSLNEIQAKKNHATMKNHVKASNKPEFEPGYLKMHHSGDLIKRGNELWKIMESCQLCPRECGVNRLEGEEGFCQGSAQLEIASFHPHFGEERPLVGRGGSGTIFFTNCGLRCVFCINYDISQEGRGEAESIEKMAQMMLHLQQIGCIYSLPSTMQPRRDCGFLWYIIHVAGKK
jgi:putative pyruvate formate lyase activating enzyme